jgi:ribose transport system permease protein
MISGFTASLAGIVLASRLSSGHPMAGDGMEMDAIAATVLGGTNIFGGIGNVWGTIIGAFILVVISNGLNLMNVSPYVQFIMKGAILAFAVAINSMKGFQKS